MSNIYTAGTSRRTAVFVAIIGLHIGFFWALKQGLVRAGLQLVQDFAIMDLPPPPPPPENLDEPPPPPPVDVPPPVVPPPLIDLPAFEGPTTAITVQVKQEAPRAAPQAPPRQVQITPPTMRTRSDRINAAINACYPSASRRLNEEGRVVATITVGADGRAGTISVAQSSGFERLDGAAECVIRKLAFNPGKRDGTPVEAQATLPIVFKLE